jgi:hypothetical protein
LNVFVWEAAKDLPDTFVDPAFIKMSVNVTKDASSHIEFQDGEVPTLVVNRPIPAFQAIQFLANQTRTSYASSVETELAPGVYRGETLEKELLESLGTHVWCHRVQKTLVNRMRYFQAMLKMAQQNRQ